MPDNKLHQYFKSSKFNRVYFPSNFISWRDKRAKVFRFLLLQWLTIEEKPVPRGHLMLNAGRYVASPFKNYSFCSL